MVSNIFEFINILLFILLFKSGVLADSSKLLNLTLFSGTSLKNYLYTVNP